MRGKTAEDLFDTPADKTWWEIQASTDERAQVRQGQAPRSLQPVI
jgi:hypothetical protein